MWTPETARTCVCQSRRKGCAASSVEAVAPAARGLVCGIDCSRSEEGSSRTWLAIWPRTSGRMNLEAKRGPHRTWHGDGRDDMARLVGRSVGLWHSNGQGVTTVARDEPMSDPCNPHFEGREREQGAAGSEGREERAVACWAHRAWTAERIRSESKPKSRLPDQIDRPVGVASHRARLSAMIRWHTSPSRSAIGNRVRSTTSA